MDHCLTADINEIKKGQRHLDNIPAEYTARLAVDGDEATCSHTDYANATHRPINPFWAILLKPQSAISSLELVLSSNKEQRGTHFDFMSS